MLAVGCLGKTLSLWKLPQTLVFQTKVANKIKNHKKAVVDWRTEDVAQWITEVGLPEVAQKILSSSLDGSNILTLSADQICSQLELSKFFSAFSHTYDSFKFVLNMSRRNIHQTVYSRARLASTRRT